MAVAAVDRVPPQNLEAEVAVLGSMLLDRDAIATVVELLRPEDFYREAHRLVYTAITELFERGEPCDLITVTDRLRDLGRLDDAGGPAYVSSLLNAVPTAANAEYYARIVLQKAMLRQLVRAGTQIAHMGFEGDEDVEALVDRAERLVFEIANRGMAQDFQAIRELIKETMDRLDAGYERGMITGVPTGFVDLDELTGGLQPGDLIIVAARPSMGKCLKHDARIVDVRTGEVRTIEDIVRAQDVSLLTLDPATARLRETTPAAFVDDGHRPVFRVRTALGRQVDVTATHPFLTPGGWRPLARLRPGHRIAVPARIPVFGTLDLPAHEVKLIAYLSAGRLPADPEVSRDFLDAVTAAAAVRAARVPALARYAAHAGDPETLNSAATARVLAEIAQDHRGLESAPERRRLPQAVFQLNRGKLCLLLNRLLACTATVDGPVESRESRVESQQSRVESRESRVNSQESRVESRESRVESSGSAADLLGRQTDPLTGFAIRVALPSEAIARQVQHLLLRLGVVAAWDGSAGLEVRGEAALQLLRSCGVLGWERLRQWALWAPQMLLPESDIVWDMIAAIDAIGDHQVYDLTVPGTHNFVADDVCVHNTTLCLNMAQHAATQHQTPVAIFSIETSAEQLVQRMLCAEAGVDGQRLRRGYLSEADWRRLTRAMGLLVEAPIYIDDSSTLSVIEIRAKSRKLKAEHGLGLIVVDYIQLIQSYKRTENRTQELSEIARGIKSLAKELHVPILAVSQLSRAAEQGASKIPMLSHLRECVTGDTVVWDADTGRRHTVGELAIRRQWPRLLSLDAEGRLVPVRPAAVLEKGENEVLELRTSTGRRLKATANHPILTPDGWTKLGSLRRGDQIAAARRLPIFGPRPDSLSPSRLRLLGYLIGDGGYQRHREVSFISADPPTLEDCISIAEREFGVTARRGQANGIPEVNFVAVYPKADGSSRAYGRPYGNPLREWLRELGVVGQSSYSKRIPERVFYEASEDGMRALLRALFSTDGCLTRRRYHRNGVVLWSLHYDTVSLGLACDVRDLLLRFGIVSQVSSGYKSKKGTVPIYRVCIEDTRHLAVFCENIGIEGRKGLLVERCLGEIREKRPKPQVDRLPRSVTDELWSHKRLTGLSWKQLGFRLQTGKSLDRPTALMLAERLGVQRVALMASNDVLWDRIADIAPRGREPVFDLVMPTTHNFVANGLVVHNSGELEQVADLVVFLYREDYYDLEKARRDGKENVALVRVAKHRNGPTDDLELFFHKEHSKFANLDRKHGSSV